MQVDKTYLLSPSSAGLRHSQSGKGDIGHMYMVDGKCKESINSDSGVLRMSLQKCKRRFQIPRHH